MKHGEIFLALGTDEFYLAKNLGIVLEGSKAAIFVLRIERGEGRVLSYFIKRFIVAALGTGYPIGRSGKVIWLHEQLGGSGLFEGSVGTDQVQFFTRDFEISFDQDTEIDD